MEVLWYGRDLRKRPREQKEGEKREERRWVMRKLVGRQEDVFESQARPADRTSFSRKTDGSTFDAPAEPGKKLLLLALDQHRSTSDAKSTDDRLMRFQFARKPV